MSTSQTLNPPVPVNAPTIVHVDGDYSPRGQSCYDTWDRAREEWVVMKYDTLHLQPHGAQTSVFYTRGRQANGQHVWKAGLETYNMDDKKSGRVQSLRVVDPPASVWYKDIEDAVKALRLLFWKGPGEYPGVAFQRDWF